MNKKIKFLIAICLGFGVGFLFDNNFAFSNSLDSSFYCNINYNQTTNKSKLKDIAPKIIEVTYLNKNLKIFTWDGERLDRHFEILNSNGVVNLEIASKGFSDIKNAVYFNIRDDRGSLAQHDILGVDYNCKKVI